MWLFRTRESMGHPANTPSMVAVFPVRVLSAGALLTTSAMWHNLGVCYGELVPKVCAVRLRCAHRRVRRPSLVFAGPLVVAVVGHDRYSSHPQREPPGRTVPDSGLLAVVMLSLVVPTSSRSPVISVVVFVC